MGTLNILSIGGSDPSSGAGVQGDVRIISELGGHCFSVVTALTSQNTSSYSGTFEVPASTIKDQLDSVLEDFEVSAVKVGMVYGSKTMRAVAQTLRKIAAPVIVDPVMVSTTGGALMRKSAIGTFCSTIIPEASVITPNVAEAKALASKQGPDASAKELLRYGADSVIVTGVQCGKSVCDHIFDPKKTVIKAKNVRLADNHGGGCAHSAAIAFAMGQGRNTISAARFAQKFVTLHAAQGARIGKGVPITGTGDSVYKTALAQSIMSFCAMPQTHTLIPECQTNFVLAPPGATKPSEVLGILGRITRAGTRPIVAGSIERGGSQHVANGLCAMRAKFPDISSCINIRRTKDILDAAQKLGLSISSFDRSKEPTVKSKREGTTLLWGISHAISKASVSPDIVHNAGAHGKEPMILIFGKDSADVLDKVNAILAQMNFT